MMSKQPTFTDALLFSRSGLKRSKTHAKLLIINQAINWQILEKSFVDFDKTKTTKGGRPPIALSIKIKMLFLQYLYNMSDEFLEDSLLGNLDYQEFVGLYLSEGVPDFTTHWRFKEKIVKNNLLEKLWQSINEQLAAKSIYLQQGKISIIDATLINSTNRPLSHDERKELKENPSSQKDTDATSTEKNGEKYFGYKGHVNVDGETKLIKKFEFTTAKDHDITQFENLLTGKEKEAYGDKAYRSKDLEKKALLVKVKYKVLRKAYRNQPLSQESIHTNKQWSKVRSRVEHAFAYIKIRLKYQVARAKNLNRNKLGFMMNVVLYNIFRTNYLLKKVA